MRNGQGQSQGQSQGQHRNESNPRSRGTMASLTKPKTVSINVASEDDFPTLGVPKPVLTATVPVLTATTPYIKMAKDWGKKLEEEKEANIIRIRNAEEERHIIAKQGTQEKIKPKNKMIITGRKNQYYDNKDGTFKAIVEDDLSDDSFESGPSREEEDFENDVCEDDEMNANLVRDRRHDNELY
jgi:hypothetical protein